MKESESFEEIVNKHVRNRVIEQIKSFDFVRTEYSDRKPLPKEFLDNVWKTVNWDKVLEDIKPMIHTRICNAIIGNMETEIKTDVKNILSIAGVREKFRIEVYPKIISVLNGEQNEI